MSVNNQKLLLAVAYAVIIFPIILLLSVGLVGSWFGALVLTLHICYIFRKSLSEWIKELRDELSSKKKKQ